jgi:AraC-like DNA-binding protein
MSRDKGEQTLPAVHALHLAELVQRWGVKGELLSSAGLREESLTQPDARLSIRAFEALVDRARALTGEPAIGVHLGLQMRVSAHGYLGFAAMTAANVREALELAVRFAPTRTTALSLRLQVEGDVAALVVEENADFGTARDVVLFAFLIGIWQIGTAITGHDGGGRVEFAFPEPAYWARVAHAAPPAWRGVESVRFGQPVNQLLFDAAELDMPMKMADRASLRLAQEQCERALDALGAGGQIVARARGLIAKKEGGARSVEEVAALMHLSPRTLKRRLAEQGVTFSSLAESELRERAMLLLRSADLSLEQVAERVGYSDVANFTRAFRRWTGHTPARYRRSGGATEP